jgi:hypothetical protein
MKGSWKGKPMRFCKTASEAASSPLQPPEILTDSIVTRALAKAWAESNPGLSGGHEEGGHCVESNE